MLENKHSNNADDSHVTSCQWLVYELLGFIISTCEKKMAEMTNPNELYIEIQY